MTTKTHPTPVLYPGVIYDAGDRLVCAKMRCCGQTALYTGRTINGAVLQPIGGRHVIEHVAMLGNRPLACECGALAATYSMRDGLSVVRTGGAR